MQRTCTVYLYTDTLWINKSFEYQWEAALMQQQVTDGASGYLFFFGTWYLGSLKPPCFPNPKTPPCYASPYKLLLLMGLGCKHLHGDIPIVPMPLSLYAMQKVSYLWFTYSTSKFTICLYHYLLIYHMSLV